MDSHEYFARVYVLLCKKEGKSPEPQPFFPASYLHGAPGETVSKVRKRRIAFYMRTRLLYRLVEGATDLNEGQVVDLEVKKTFELISAKKNAEGEGISRNTLPWVYSLDALV